MVPVLIARDDLPCLRQSFGGGESESSLAFECSPLKERKELLPIDVLIVKRPSKAELWATDDVGRLDLFSMSIVFKKEIGTLTTIAGRCSRVALCRGM